ncbi:DUF1934 domain-containing protein [Roseburia sp. BX1005]|jgi:conserved hypothetical protein|uniref:DUF1934 domain-containing protein n=1 Tax=Roseburia zhanii TaxID=2763064 RepID=A0A923LPD4_9FIRM|nr:DUF1934 domain-containing protein [Roseburia zhanii]MBC5714453.1 DUF1934 domain-containing protein [Roseburia zhanii]
MTKDVLVTISGLQIMSMAEDSEPVEVITAGDYYKKNNKHYVIYDEVTEGFDGTTKNIIKLQEDCVDITKRGITNVHMVFEKNKKNITCYQTPFGNLMLGIDAKNISIKEDEHDISVNVEYALELNYEHIADCTVKMAIQSKEGSGFHICS